MTSLKELMDLRGRVGVVTGASGHIGRAICNALGELGCDLALIDRNESVLNKQAKLLGDKFSIDVTAIDVDLESEKARSAIPDRLRDRFTRTDILVNNAAFVGDSGLTGWSVPFDSQELDAWRRAIEVNLTACFHLSQCLTPMLRTHAVGSIINVGSIYGVVGPDMSLYAGTEMGNPAAYAASKGGLVQLTRWMSTVLAPDIRINCISPGGVERGQPSSFVQQYIARTPMKRMATEDDSMGAIAFLATDLSRYVTGQNLMVDGGWTAW